MSTTSGEEIFSIGEPDNVVYGEFESNWRETIAVLQHLSPARQQEVLRQANLLLLEQQQEDQNSTQRAGQ